MWGRQPIQALLELTDAMQAGLTSLDCRVLEDQAIYRILDDVERANPPLIFQSQLISGT